MQKEMTNKLYLIRGLPGAGKSTLAKKMCFENQNLKHFESDMFFETKDGYKFDPKKIGEAHRWCQNLTEEYLSISKSHSCVVSNTFTQLWEMEPYFKIAKKLNIPCEVIEAKGNFKNVHNVPELTLQKMKVRWESFPEGNVNLLSY